MSSKNQDKEREDRLAHAENILGDLTTGYWQCILNDNDDPVKEPMGDRVQNYWKRFTKQDGAE